MILAILAILATSGWGMDVSGTSNSKWSSITGFPSACSSGKAVSTIAATPTCTSFAASGANTDITSIGNITVGSGGTPNIACNYLGFADYTGNASSKFTVSATTTTQGNAGTNVELYFATATINANTLTANGAYIQYECAGTLAADGNNKSALIEANTSTTLADTVVTAGIPVANDMGWKITGTIARTSLNNQVWNTSTMYAKTTTGKAHGGATTLTETAAITLACTGKSGTNTVGDVSFLYMRVWACGAPS